jgi:hypothetical protein
MGSSTKGGKNCVVVGNIHVLFNPKRGDVKLGQVLDWNSGSLLLMCDIERSCRLTIFMLRFGDHSLKQNI